MKKSAFRAFYSETVGPLCAYVRHASGDADLAEDLAHETYLRFLTSESKSRSFQHDKNYLYKIATNLVRDHWRAAHRRREAAQRSPKTRTATTPNMDLRIDLEAALEQLQPNERAMLWLAYVEGFAHREIAVVLDVQVDSVRVLLHRARQKIAHILRGPVPE